MLADVVKHPKVYKLKILNLVMKTYLINYATPNFYKSQERLNNTASKYVDKILSFTRDWLVKTDFYKNNQKILDGPRGGYYLWKPFIILQTLQKMKDGEVLFYCDSGVDLKDDPKKLLNEFVGKNKNIFIFRNDEEVLNKTYTKRDCFILMNCDSKEYWDAPQAIAGFSGWVKNKKTLDFVKEWLEYGKDERIISFSPNVMGKPNLDSFIEHRWDQSILSLMAKKHGVVLHKGSNNFLIVHRERERKGLELIKYKAKLLVPVSIKNKIKSLFYR
jgi:hypothetical protein